MTGVFLCVDEKLGENFHPLYLLHIPRCFYAKINIQNIILGVT